MLYENIVRLCEQHGTNIFKLEQATNLGNATIRGWKTSSPRVESVKRVADYFGVSVDELLQEKAE